MNRIEGMPQRRQSGMRTAARLSPGAMKPLYGVPVVEEVVNDVEYKCKPETVNLEVSLLMRRRFMRSKRVRMREREGGENRFFQICRWVSILTHNSVFILLC